MTAPPPRSPPPGTHSRGCSAGPGGRPPGTPRRLQPSSRVAASRNSLAGLLCWPGGTTPRNPPPASAVLTGRRLQELTRGVEVAVGAGDDAVEAAAAVGGAAGDAERAVGDRVQQPVPADPPEQVHRLAEYLVGPLLHEPARRRPEVLAQPGGGAGHIAGVLQGQVTV